MPKREANLTKTEIFKWPKTREITIESQSSVHNSFQNFLSDLVRFLRFKNKGNVFYVEGLFRNADLDLINPYHRLIYIKTKTALDLYRLSSSTPYNVRKIVEDIASDIGEPNQASFESIVFNTYHSDWDSSTANFLIDGKCFVVQSPQALVFFRYDPSISVIDNYKTILISLPSVRGITQSLSFFNRKQAQIQHIDLAKTYNVYLYLLADKHIEINDTDRDILAYLVNEDFQRRLCPVNPPKSHIISFQQPIKVQEDLEIHLKIVRHLSIPAIIVQSQYHKTGRLVPDLYSNLSRNISQIGGARLLSRTITSEELMLRNLLSSGVSATYQLQQDLEPAQSSRNMMPIRPYNRSIHTYNSQVSELRFPLSKGRLTEHYVMQKNVPEFYSQENASPQRDSNRYFSERYNNLINHAHDFYNPQMQN